MRVLKAPFPQVSLIAAGGVNQKNASDYVLAGASALGIGQHLIHQNSIKRRERERIHELARRYTTMVSDARSQRAI
jgi:2-dehydro-3-deoxyphosphogluconate aldolase/(4S)-4-hydroxy-2-oxoglutarate aldolase